MKLIVVHKFFSLWWRGVISTDRIGSPPPPVNHKIQLKKPLFIPIPIHLHVILELFMFSLFIYILFTWQDFCKVQELWRMSAIFFIIYWRRFRQSFHFEKIPAVFTELFELIIFFCLRQFLLVLQYVFSTTSIYIHLTKYFNLKCSGLLTCGKGNVRVFGLLCRL